MTNQGMTSDRTGKAVTDPRNDITMNPPGEFATRQHELADTVRFEAGNGARVPAETRGQEASERSPQRVDPQRVDSVVVGAGQAGLSTAYYLRQYGVEAVVLDEHDRVGDQWRHRYDSLRLFTPARYDRLPGMRFQQIESRWPTGYEMADYLERYAATMQLDVRGRAAVQRVAPTDGGRYEVATGAATYLARNVVIATGGDHFPRVPEFAGQLDPGIRQLHSADYRNPHQLLPGPTLVVGAGTSGADLALEIAQAGHETWLSGKLAGEVPFDIESPFAPLVEPILWFVANHVLTIRTPIGRKAQPVVRSSAGPLVRVKPAHLRAAGVQLAPARTVGVSNGRPRLADGAVLDVANVVWCTGFRQDFGIVDLPIAGPDGWPLEEGGVVPSAPGLYFAGLLFQRGFHSMLVGGAARDAKFIAKHIRARARAGVTA